MASSKDKTIVGRAETVTLVDLNRQKVPAKIDTGADRSSIWASEIVEKDGKLSFVLFGKSSDFYTGQRIELSKDHYTLTRVESSFGHREFRYVVHLKIKLSNRLVNASFTLADRQFKIYPILIGRKLLNGKFLIDVSLGTPLKEQEEMKHQALQLEIKNMDSKKEG